MWTPYLIRCPVYGDICSVNDLIITREVHNVKVERIGDVCEVQSSGSGDRRHITAQERRAQRCSSYNGRED